MKAKPQKFKAIWVTIFALLAIMLFANACQKDKFEIPVVHTGEVVEITPDGVIFHGKIIEQGNREITDHGFVWGLKSNPTFESDYKITMGSILEQLFKAEISAALQEGKQYHVRAFAKTENQIIYGRTVSFISLGSKLPVITQFQPESGIWGDTITLWVENLSPNIEDFELFLGSQKVQMLYYSEDSLQLSVPETMTDSVFTISIRMFNNEVLASSTFKIDPPEIFYFTPAGGITDSTIFISGRAFHPNKIRNKVFLGNTELEIITHSKNSFKVRIPGWIGIEHGEYNIKVKTIDREAVSQSLFMYYQPWKRLNDIPSGFFTTGLHFRVGPRVFILGMYFSNLMIEYDPENDSWTQRTGPPFTTYPARIAAHTLSYGYALGVPQYPDYIHPLTQYNPLTDKWTHKSHWPVNFYEYEGISTFCIGNEFFLCGGTNGEGYSNTLHYYNEATDSWGIKANFPQTSNINGSGFSILGKGYIALGSVFLYSSPNLNIYEYDPVSNSWDIKTTFEGILEQSHFGRGHAKVFIINDKAYIFGGHSVSLSGGIFKRDAYEFDPVSNKIKRLPEMPVTGHKNSLTFSANGKGYLSPNGRQLWEFDPSKLPPWLQ
jgi:hypothetical protein